MLNCQNLLIVQIRKTWMSPAVSMSWCLSQPSGAEPEGAVPGQEAQQVELAQTVLQAAPAWLEILAAMAMARLALAGCRLSL